MADNKFLNNLVLELGELNISSYIPNEDEQKRFKRIILDVVNYTPELQNCPIDSIIECAVKGATSKLELNRHFNMVPRAKRAGEQKKAKFELTYQGFVTLLSRSNIAAKSNVVYKNDVIDIDFGLEKISHKPCLDGDRGEPIGVYAVIQLDQHRKIIDYMSWKEIDNFRAKYLRFESDAWRNSTTEMAKKTILKRTAKPYLHIDWVDDSVYEAVALDNNTETNDGETLNISENTPELDISKITVDMSSLPAPKLPPVQEKKITEKQVGRLFAIINSTFSESDKTAFIEVIKEKYKLESIKDLNMNQYQEVCDSLITDQKKQTNTNITTK